MTTPLKIAKQGEPICKSPNCGKSPVTRGVCPNCYVGARRLVAEKAATWETLEKMGLVNPAHVKAAKNPLIVAFLARKNGSSGSGEKGKAGKQA